MSSPTIRSKGTGTPEFRNGHWWVKVSLPDNTRPRYRLCIDGACTCVTMSDAMKEERCKAISERKRGEVRAELASQRRLARRSVSRCRRSASSGRRASSSECTAR